MGFKITTGKGFHITFGNGYTVSVQFGSGNYCSHYNVGTGSPYDEKCGKEGSPDAECAVWGRDGVMIERKDWGDTVKGRMSPKEVLELLNWAAEQEEVGGTVTRLKGK